MKSSDLKYRINIYKQHVDKTDFGRTNITFEPRCSCRARVNYLSGNRIMDNEEVFYSVDREFIIRSYVPIEYTDVIEYDGDFWQVLSIDKIHEFNDIVVKTTRLNDGVRIYNQETNGGQSN